MEAALFATTEQVTMPPVEVEVAVVATVNLLPEITQLPEIVPGLVVVATYVTAPVPVPPVVAKVIPAVPFAI